MIIDLLLMALAILLGVGFYTGRTDWVLIHYGCAPKNEKENMNGEIILTIAWASMFAIIVLMGLNVLFQYCYIRFLVRTFRWLSLLIFVGMYGVTFYIAHKKKIVKFFKKKFKSNSVTEESTEDKPVVAHEVKEVKHEVKKDVPKKKKKHSGNTHNTKSKNQRIQEALKGRR